MATISTIIDPTIAVTGEEILFAQPADTFRNYWGSPSGIPAQGGILKDFTIRKVAHSTARQMRFTGAGHDQPIFAIKVVGERVRYVTSDVVFYIDGERFGIIDLINAALAED